MNRMNRADRHPLDALEGRRPDRRGHRHEVAAGQLVAVRRPAQVVAERPRLRVRPIEQARRATIEMQDVSEQTIVRGRGQIVRLREEPAESATAVLEPGEWTADGERHIRRRRLDPDLGEEPHQQRVGVRVVDEKARIERDRTGGAVHCDRVRVTSEAIVLFQQGDAMAPAQQVGGRQARDSRPDHRDVFHGRFLTGPSVARANEAAMIRLYGGRAGVVKAMSMT